MPYMHYKNMNSHFIGHLGLEFNLWVCIVIDKCVCMHWDIKGDYSE